MTSITAEKHGYSRGRGDGHDRTSFSVNVNAGNCAIQDLSLWTNNSLQGTVKDATGNTVAGISVFLEKVNGDRERYGDEERTNKDGQFKFERIDPRPHAGFPREVFASSWSGPMANVFRMVLSVVEMKPRQTTAVLTPSRIAGTDLSAAPSAIARIGSRLSGLE